MATLAAELAVRFQRSKQKIQTAVAGDVGEGVPLVIRAWPYHVFGTDPRRFPQDYFTNPRSMLEYQTASCEAQLTTVQDDFIPYVMPWYGTGVLASAFGCGVAFLEDSDPAVSSWGMVKDEREVARLRVPDPERDGLMPRVLEAMAYMKAHSEFPVGLTDMQSPLDTLTLVAGYDRLFVWMYEQPALVHQLMTLASEALIAWVRAQKRVLGEADDETNGLQNAWLPKGHGLWLSDDDATQLSPALYAEFVAPYNDRILRAFGGGALHHCGDVSRFADSFARMGGLRALNNWPLGDVASIRRLRERLPEMTIVVGDVAPLEPQMPAYYGGLLEVARSGRLIIQPSATETVAIAEGGYTATRRDPIETARQIWAAVETLASSH